MTHALPDSRITLIVGYMQQHLGEPLSIPRLARIVNLSESRFRALFFAEIRVPPGQYVQKLRLLRARLLLERTFLTAREVMALVGYDDPDQFAKDFTREHGAPPSAVASCQLPVASCQLPASGLQLPPPATRRRSARRACRY